MAFFDKNLATSAVIRSKLNDLFKKNLKGHFMVPILNYLEYLNTFKRRLSGSE